MEGEEEKEEEEQEEIREVEEIKEKRQGKLQHIFLWSESVTTENKMKRKFHEENKGEEKSKKK